VYLLLIAKYNKIAYIFNICYAKSMKILRYYYGMTFPCLSIARTDRSSWINLSRLASVIELCK